MLKYRNICRWTVSAALLMSLQSCFTGIEYTPAITDKDVKKEKIKEAPEDKMAEMFTPEPVARWRPGKLLYVTDPKIELALSGKYSLQKGDTLVYVGTRQTQGLLGDEYDHLLFTSRSLPGDTVESNITPHITPATNLARIPFTIDLEVIEKMRKALVGNVYYINTALWYTPTGDTARGRKFIPVKITGVMPFSEDYPAIVAFLDEATGATGHVLMSQNTTGSMRGFSTLFSLSDPRAKFPDISDSNWQAIQNSQVRDGMTRTEVMLALGSPASIDRGHNQSSAFERWRYTDGITLIFIDGILSK